MRAFNTPPMRVLFMGTPAFATPALAALLANSAPGLLWASGLDLVGVVTRPDKPTGRGRKLAFSPVKQFAVEQQIPVFQPGPLRSDGARKLLSSLAPDVIIVAAFGQILPLDILELPTHCCLNIHASLLPRHRGAAPISAAILAGDALTGVTLMLMEEGLDTGPILAQREVAIAPDETTGSLTEKLAQLGARLLVEALPEWLAGGLTPQSQDDAQATFTRPIRREECRLDWSLPATDLDRRVRAFSPRPGAFTHWQGRQVKILQSHAAPSETSERHQGECFQIPGSPDLLCACGQGALALEVIQLEGKRALPAVEALHGHPTLATATFS